MNDIVRRAVPWLALAVLIGGAAGAAAQGSQLSVPPGAAPAAPAPAAPAAQPATGAAAPAVARPSTAPAKAAPTAPSGLQPLSIGPVQITPTRIVLRTVSNKNIVCLEPVIRLRATNIGTSDLRLALIGEGLAATDDLGITLLQGDARRITPSVVGVTRVDTLNDWNAASTTGASRVTLVAPGQSVSLQLTRGKQPASIHCQQDSSGDFRRSYRPSAVTLTATLGVIDISGNAELRTFSLFDIPVDVSRN